MASLWRPKEGKEVHDLGNYRYSFIFFHILDLQKVIEGGPWSFEQSMHVCHRLSENEDPHSIPLQDVDIWVQLYDVPKGFISETVLKSIGDSFGCYIKSDPANFNKSWKDHLRIKVTMNITKPLKWRMKLKCDANNWNSINFKYERLSSFCFVCGKIGHSDSDCSAVYANPEKLIERVYGDQTRRKQAIPVIQLQTPVMVMGGSPKFMEVDGGMIREISGDDEWVKKRDIGGSWTPGLPDIMSLLAWNCHGMAKPRAVRFLKETISHYRPNIIFLSNTLVKSNKIADICKNIGFTGFFAVDVQGHREGGGLALFWKNEDAVQIIDSSNNYIDFEVSNDQVGRWRYTGIYGYPEIRRRVEAWNMISMLAQKPSLPWCMIGDYNDLMFDSEKKGGRKQPRALLQGFSDIVANCGLIDFGYEGEYFNWERCRGTDLWIQERPERGLATRAWLNLFPNAVVKVVDVSI
ncbi:uncharacterized protein LOC141683745 [Apium graveolens]|uniref:uncharacterized protein LOC141683745 n=1 Tax=Apium graveolens TaxID=4045 RepID=UPI003D78E3F8